MKALVKVCFIYHTYIHDSHQHEKLIICIKVFNLYRKGTVHDGGGRNEEEGRSGYMMEGEGMRRKEGVGT